MILFLICKMDCIETIISNASVYSQNHKKEEEKKWNYMQYLKNNDQSKQLRALSKQKLKERFCLSFQRVQDIWRSLQALISVPREWDYNIWAHTKDFGITFGDNDQKFKFCLSAQTNLQDIHNVRFT